MQMKKIDIVVTEIAIQPTTRKRIIINFKNLKNSYHYSLL